MASDHDKLTMAYDRMNQVLGRQERTVLLELLSEARAEGRREAYANASDQLDHELKDYLGEVLTENIRAALTIFVSALASKGGGK